MLRDYQFTVKSVYTRTGVEPSGFDYQGSTLADCAHDLGASAQSLMDALKYTQVQSVDINCVLPAGFPVIGPYDDGSIPLSTDKTPVRAGNWLRVLTPNTWKGRNTLPSGLKLTNGMMIYLPDIPLNTPLLPTTIKYSVSTTASEARAVTDTTAKGFVLACDTVYQGRIITQESGAYKSSAYVKLAEVTLADDSSLLYVGAPCSVGTASYATVSTSLRGATAAGPAISCQLPYGRLPLARHDGMDVSILPLLSGATPVLPWRDSLGQVFGSFIKNRDARVSILDSTLRVDPASILFPSGLIDLNILMYSRLVSPDTVMANLASIFRDPVASTKTTNQWVTEVGQTIISPENETQAAYAVTHSEETYDPAVSYDSTNPDVITVVNNQIDIRPELEAQLSAMTTALEQSAQKVSAGIGKLTEKLGDVHKSQTQMCTDIRWILQDRATRAAALKVVHSKEYTTSSAKSF